MAEVIINANLKKMSTSSKEPNKEELLEEAKRKYPIGSQVKSVFDDLFDTVKEQSHFNYPDAWNGDTPQIWFTGDRFGLLIYDRGKWAKIVSKPESAEKMEEPKFIVGKWYKNFLYSKTCARFVKMEDSNFIGDMWISRDGNYIFEKFESSCFDKAELISTSDNGTEMGSRNLCGVSGRLWR
jgi:hypothetical protein